MAIEIHLGREPALADDRSDADEFGKRPEARHWWVIWSGVKVSGDFTAKADAQAIAESLCTLREHLDQRQWTRLRELLVADIDDTLARVPTRPTKVLTVGERAAYFVAVAQLAEWLDTGQNELDLDGGN